MSKGDDRAAFEKWLPTADLPQHMRNGYTAEDVEHAEREAAWAGWQARGQQEPLTPERIKEMWDKLSRYHGGEPCRVSHFEFARAIEREVNR